MTQDLFARASGYAQYLPAVQAFSAFNLAVPEGAWRGGSLPAQLKIADLNYLMPGNAFWAYPKALACVVHFHGKRQPNIICDRSRRGWILGDSGGFQAGKGSSHGIFKAISREITRGTRTAHDAWINANVTSEVAEWQENNCNCGTALDIPLWCLDPKNIKSLFAKSSSQQIINLYEWNLQVVDALRQKSGFSSPVLNVLQGRDFQEAHEWFQVAKQYKLEGWSLGGGVGRAGGIGRVIRALLMLRDQKLLDPDYDRCHILMLGKPKWAPLLTAAQRGIRQTTNEVFEITYDSSSPYMVAGKYDEFYSEPELGRDLKKWSMQTHKLPMGVMIGRDTTASDLSKTRCDYSSRCQSCKFTGDHLPAPMNSPIAKLLTLQDMNIHRGSFDTRFVDKFSTEVLVNHNAYAVINTMIRANDCVYGNAPTANERILAAADHIEELFKAQNWMDKLEALREELGQLVGDRKESYECQWPPNDGTCMI